MKQPNSQDELTGVQRAAVLLLSLGEGDAAEVLKHMGAKEVQKLGLAMATMSAVSREQVLRVMDDFEGALAKQTSLGVGADDYIRNVLIQALGADKASGLIDRILLGRNTTGLDTLKWMDPRAVADLVRNEHPQIIAIVLSHLDSDQAADALKFLPERTRADVLLRIATLDGIPPNALNELNDGARLLEVATDAEHAVVSQQHGRAIAQRRHCRLRQRLARRWCVRGDLDRAPERHHLLVEDARDRQAGDGERARVRRVGVDHCSCIGASAVRRDVAQRLARWHAVPNHGLDVEIDDEHVIDREPVIGDAARGDRDEVTIGRANAAADVAARRPHETRLVDSAHGRDDCLAFLDELAHGDRSMCKSNSRQRA